MDDDASLDDDVAAPPGPGTGAPVATENRVQALLFDYQITKDDNRAVEQFLNGLIALSIPVMAGYAALLAKSCSPRGSSISDAFEQFDLGACRAVIYPPIYAFFPLVTVSILGFAAIAGILATFRDYYLRDLEVEISSALGQEAGLEKDRVFPSTANLLAIERSNSRGPFRVRILTAAIFFTIALLGIGTTVMSIWLTRPLELQVVASFFYATCTFFLARNAWVGSYSSSEHYRELLKTRRLEFERTIARGKREEVPAREKREGRALLSYLILPRPAEAVVKPWFLVGGFFYGILVTGQGFSASSMGTAFLLWLTFEFLVYQGRYTLNDLRGALGDSQHSGKSGKRIPVDASGNPTSSTLVACALAALFRISLGLYLAVRLLDGGFAKIWFVSTVAATLVLGAVYDNLRASTASQAMKTYRVGSDAAPLLEGTGAYRWIFLLVGGGYALRLTLGLAVAGENRFGAGIYLMSTVTFMAFGIMFVAMTWAIDSLLVLGVLNGRGELTYGLHGSLLAYPHYGVLVRQWSEITASAPEALGEKLVIVAEVSGEKAVAEKREDWKQSANPLLSFKPLVSCRGFNWWSTPYVFALACSGALAALVVLDATGPQAVGFGLALGLVASIGVWVLNTLALAVTSSLTAAALWWTSSAGVKEAALGLVPSIIIIVAYAVFRQMDPRGVQFDPSESLEGLGDLLLKFLFWFLSSLVGKAAAEALFKASLSAGMLEKLVARAGGSDKAGPDSTQP